MWVSPLDWADPVRDMGKTSLFIIKCYDLSLADSTATHYLQILDVVLVPDAFAQVLSAPLITSNPTKGLVQTLFCVLMAHGKSSTRDTAAPQAKQSSLALKAVDLRMGSVHVLSV